MIKFDAKTLIKEFGKSLAFFLILLSIANGLNIDTSSVTQNTIVKDNSEMARSAQDECSEKDYWESLENWEMPGLKVDIENEKICAKSRSTYFTDATYKISIPLRFNSYSLSYIVNYENDTIPPYLVRLGNNFVDFYLHENNPELIGLSTVKLNDQGELDFSREVSLELTSAPQNGTEVEVNIKYLESQGREMIYSLSIKYLTVDNPVPAIDSFTIKSLSNDPSQNSLIKVGFGTAKGECILPRSYRICQ